MKIKMCVEKYSLIMSTSIVIFPTREFGRPLEKHSTTAPLRASVAVVWAVEVNIVGLDDPLIMVIVNRPHISSRGIKAP